MPAVISPNLPPEAMPWARDRDLRLLALEREMTRRTQNEGNTNKSQNSSMELLTQQVTGLAGAVASVIAPSFSQDGIGNYAISTTSTPRKSVTFTVPTGYTKALVMATASAMGLNGTASGDYLFVQASVNGVSGGELYSYAGPGLAVGLSALLYWELTGLTGGDTFPVSVQTRTNTNPWPAIVSNQANIYALVLYLR